MDKTTHEVRLSQWKQVVEQCQARPEGQTAKQWLAENGISSKSYYYWLRKIRKQTYEQSGMAALSTGQGMLPSAAAPATVSFAEIPFPVPGGSADENAFQPTAVVKIGNASIAFSNSVSENLLSRIILEVNSHA